MSDGKKRRSMGGGQVCSVAVCKNYYSKTKGNKVSYYVFPKDPSIRKIWVANCRRGGVWNLENARVCSDHFAEDQFVDDVEARIMNIKRPRRLKESAIPTLKLESPTPVKRRVSHATDNEQVQDKRTLLATSIKTEPDEYTCDEDTYSQSVDKSVQTDEEVEVISPNQILEVNVLEADSCINCRNLNIAPVLVENTRLMGELLHAKSQCVSLKRNLEELKAKLKDAELEKVATKAFYDKRELNHKKEVERLSKVEASFRSVFTRSQIDLLSKCKKRINWEGEVIRRSLTLRRISRKAFLYVKNIMKIPLPGVSSLQRWMLHRRLRNLQNNILNGTDSTSILRNSLTSKKSVAKMTLKSLANASKKSLTNAPKKPLANKSKQLTVNDCKESLVNESEELLVEDSKELLVKGESVDELKEELVVESKESSVDDESDEVFISVLDEAFTDVSDETVVIVCEDYVEEGV